jgi:hypothetical protein
MTNASNQEIVINPELQATNITINDFSDFELYTDHTDLTSTNNNTNIEFDFSGSDTDLGEVFEIYEFFSEVKFRDFEVNITVFHTTSTNIWGSFDFDFYEVVKMGESNYIQRVFCGCGFTDTQVHYGGSHTSCCLYDLETLYGNMTEYGALPSTGTTTFRIKKVANIVNCTTLENDILIKNMTYVTTLVDFANAIHFKVATGTLTPDFTINILDISGSIILAIDETPSPTPTIEFSITNVGLVSILSIASFQILIIKRKRRNEK